MNHQLIQYRVIEIMKLLGFQICYSNLPKISLESLDISSGGFYTPKTHHIQINDKLPPREQEITLAHELTHSLQNSSCWDLFTPYFARKHEQEAYAVQYLYELMYMYPKGISSLFRLITRSFDASPNFAGNWMKTTQRKMLQDKSIMSHEDLGSLIGSVVSKHLPF